MMYTCEQVAERYGVKVSTVWKWVRTGKLAGIRVGKGYRFKDSAVDDFDTANSTMPQAVAEA